MTNVLLDIHFPTYPASPPKRNLTELGIVFGFSPAIVMSAICNFPVLLLELLLHNFTSHNPQPQWHNWA
jgi:hypothetical protein